MTAANDAEPEGTAVDNGEPLVRIEGLSKHFRSDSGFLGGLELSRDGGPIPLPRYDPSWVRAVDDVSLEIRKGETLGLVGESGCGKSTLARTILRLVPPTDGAVYFKGRDLMTLGSKELRTQRRDMQMIFQDPQASLDSRMKVGPIVEEPMRAHGILDKEDREKRAKELLEEVGLDPQHYNRYPHQFSGGQRQRINLARALSLNPDFIVCDEPTSALDASIQAQVLNTMIELQQEFDLTYLFISHDLSVIRYICDRVAVMYLGEIVEIAEKDELFGNPQHPYTQALFSSIPVPDPKATSIGSTLEGDVPSPVDPPSGCRFRTRCPKLIAPAAYELTDDEWEAVRAFARAVDRRTFDVTTRNELEARFFPGGIPDGDAGRAVDDALERISDDKWDSASALLTETILDRSICAQEKPAYELEPQYGDGRHFAACHLHRS